MQIYELPDKERGKPLSTTLSADSHHVGAPVSAGGKSEYCAFLVFRAKMNKGEEIRKCGLR